MTYNGYILTKAVGNASRVSRDAGRTVLLIKLNRGINITGNNNVVLSLI